MPLGAFKAALMGTAGVSTADVVLLSSQTASTSATISFTSGIDSTYGEYIFRFYNIHSGTNSTGLQFQVNADGESGYNETITSTMFRAYHTESDSAAVFQYAGDDQAQGTAFQFLCNAQPDDNDAGMCGELHLFNPSSTTYVKHFYARTMTFDTGPTAINLFPAGYINTTAAIDDIQFKMQSGNMDAGTIKMWGVK